MASQPQRPSEEIKKKSLLRLKTKLVKTLLNKDTLKPMLEAALSYRLRKPFTKHEQLQPYRCPHCRMVGVETLFLARAQFLSHLTTEHPLHA